MKRHSLHVTARLLFAAAAFTLGSLAVNAGLSSAASPPALQHALAGTAPGVRTPLIYVANASANSITAYPSGASGDVRPVLTIAGPHTRLNNPLALAHDTDGRLFVANANEHEVLVFARGASGDSAPLRYFKTPLYAPRTLAIDRNGYTYVGLVPISDSVHFFQVGVYGPTAQGNNALLRTLNIPQNSGQVAVGVDRDGDVYVAEGQGIFLASMNKYAPFAAGNVLVSSYCGNFCINAHDFEAMFGLAVSPLSGNVYVLNASFFGDRITIFNPAVTRIIGSIPGSAFGKGQLTADGIDIDGRGNVYVATPFGIFGFGNSVEVLALVGKQVVSSRAIAGPHTGLNLPVGIAFIDSN